jgi:hypothetical protein
MRFCNKPDRHEPKLTCGYPLPCPHHTAIIDTTDPDDTIVEVPLPGGPVAHVGHLLDIGDAVAGAESMGPETERREVRAGGLVIKLDEDQ